MSTRLKDDNHWDACLFNYIQDKSMNCIHPEKIALKHSKYNSEQDNEDTLAYISDSSSDSIVQDNEKKKRTVTSYDLQTSFYLKSVFFQVYSCQPKLTKQQRAQVQKKTGLPSRNITYWFSNHKRRFKDTLLVYRSIVNESNGAIKNYKDFIQWRRDHYLPDQISQQEVDELLKN